MKKILLSLVLALGLSGLAGASELSELSNKLDAVQGEAKYLLMRDMGIVATFNYNCDYTKAKPVSDTEDFLSTAFLLVLKQNGRKAAKELLWSWSDMLAMQEAGLWL